MEERKNKKTRYTLLNPVQHDSNLEFEEKQKRRERFFGADRRESAYWVIRNVHWILTVGFLMLVIYMGTIVYKDEIHQIYNAMDFRIIDCVIEEDGTDYLIHITYENPSSKEQKEVQIYRIVSDTNQYASMYDLEIVTSVWDVQWDRPRKTVLLPGYATGTVTYRICGEDMPTGTEMTIITHAYEPQEYKVRMPE